MAAVAAAPFAVEAGRVIPYRLEVLSTIPHDPDAFTQGLEIHDGVFVESTGQYGDSQARLVGFDGEELLAVEIDGQFFAEGLTRVGDRLIQLTWREGTAFVRDAETLAEVDRFTYEGEGWGLCHDGNRLVMSDGSSTLTFRDPESFDVVGSVDVTLDGDDVDMLNELECVAGHVLANRWLTTEIVIIDPTSGSVVGVVDASDLVDRLSSTAGIDVLNGIAYDEESGALYLTGKYWPEIFSVRLVEG